MRIYENDGYRDMTEEDFVQVEDVQILPYEERVVARIREKYSVDDELALLRQKETKADEFAEYNAFVEAIKAEEKAVREA